MAREKLKSVDEALKAFAGSIKGKGREHASII